MLLFPLNSIVPSGNNMQVFAGHTDAITAIAFTPDGQYESSIEVATVRGARRPVDRKGETKALD